MVLKFGYREIAAISVLLLLIVIIFITVNFKGADEMIDPEITTEVVHSWRSEGEVENSTPVSGKIWQIVEVKVTNLNDEQDFLVSVPHFHAITEEGVRVWVFNGEDFDYDPVGPGENITVTLIFHIGESETLSSLEYTQRLSGPVTCNVPPPEPYPIPTPE